MRSGNLHFLPVILTCDIGINLAERMLDMV